MRNPSEQRTGISATASSPNVGIGPKRKGSRWSLLWAPVGLVFWIYGMYGSIKEIIGTGYNNSLILPSLVEIREIAVRVKEYSSNMRSIP